MVTVKNSVGFWQYLNIYYRKREHCGKCLGCGGHFPYEHFTSELLRAGLCFDSSLGFQHRKLSGKILNLGNAALIQIVFTGLGMPEWEQPYQCSWFRKLIFLPLSFAARI